MAYICVFRLIKVKTKRQRFEEVAGRRVEFILNKLDHLSKCSNRNNYEYSEEDVSKMFSAIKDGLKITEIKFQDQLRKQGRKTFKF